MDVYIDIWKVETGSMDAVWSSTEAQAKGVHLDSINRHRKVGEVEKVA